PTQHLRLFLHHTPPPAPTYTLSLHDALPISAPWPRRQRRSVAPDDAGEARHRTLRRRRRRPARSRLPAPRRPSARVSPDRREMRSEEHTSELQSRFDLVCRLLLEKKKKITHKFIQINQLKIIHTDSGLTLIFTVSRFTY